MESRMKKYYTEELKEDAQRTKKNAPLYRQIYGAYDEFENLKLPVSNNEIDITDIGTSVTSREEYRKMKEYGSITNKNTKIVKDDTKEEVKSDNSGNRVYNINEMLANVKSNKPNSFDNVVSTSSNYLHTLQTDEEIKTDLEKVKEMYNKISEEFDKENEMERMKDVSTGALSLELLSDLKSDNTTEVMPGFGEDKDPTGASTSHINSTSNSDKDKDDKGNNNLDNTFYGGGYQFSKEDFNDDNFFDGDLDKKGHYVLKSILIIIVIILLVGCALYFLDKYNVISLF